MSKLFEKLFTKVHNISISENNRVAAELDQLEKSNLSSACFAEELKKLVEDYFCTAENTDDRIDFESDGDDKHEEFDEWGERDGDDADFGMQAAWIWDLTNEEMPQIAINMRQCHTDKASDLLHYSDDYVNNDIDKEMASVKEFMCSCKLNSDQLCYTQFHHDEVIWQCMAMQELPSGMYNVLQKLKIIIL